MTPDSIFRLGKWLRERGYHFITVTPATHARVLERDQRDQRKQRNPRGPGRAAMTLRDAFGWSLPVTEKSFTAELSPADRAELLRILREGDLLEPAKDGGERARVRFSSLGPRLFAHSAYPTLSEDSVFFGPDTYRFARFLDATVPSARHLLDLGCGSGAGGLSLGSRCAQLTLSDVSSRALEFARANARLDGQSPEFVEGDGVPPCRGEPYDVIVSNPPFLVDHSERAYRHGGGELGEGLSLRFMEQALPKLGPGGRFVMYTGSAIVDGRDRLREDSARLAREAGADLEYSEIDPDIFPEELERPVYALADRICAVGLVATKRGA